MREIQTTDISDKVAKAIQTINYQIRPDVKAALEKAAIEEHSALGRQALELLLENAKKASANVFPLCQDTGTMVVFVELGQEVRITGGLLTDAIQEGVRQASAAGRLRHSMTVHPLTRGNSGDNTPAIIHVSLVQGDQLKVTVMAKGGGCENASHLAMLPPSSSRHGFGDFVVDRLRQNAANACPPLIIGIGVGGNFSLAPLLAKKALLRTVGELSPDPELARLEGVLLERINKLGIGPQGWGGTITALSVAIEAAPCHIASLPVAINVECHSHRHQEVTL